jgi:acyl-CoA synthetase (NDP forming)
MTGGESVVVTDTFAKAGLQVPLLSQESYRELGSFFNVIGGSYRNPLDVSWNFQSPEMVTRLLTILDNDAGVDFVGLELFVPAIGRRFTSGKASDTAFFEAIAEHARQAKRPFFAWLTAASAEREAVDLRKFLTERGVLAFPSFHRAAGAYRKALDYWAGAA